MPDVLRQIVEWQPVLGCSFASVGCANCAAMGRADAGLLREKKWSGETFLNEGAMDLPRRVSAPAVIAVCSHGDLFHPATPDAWIERAFEVMEGCERHLFQVLTKRADRMRDFVLGRYRGREAPPWMWFGVSCERQKELDERAAALRATPAAVRYLTLYPMLEPMRLSEHLGAVRLALAGSERERPADPEWVLDAQRQCAAAGVPFHFGELLNGAKP